ncbi:CHAT domain-containing protein [Laspinema olomoucense]|uniref:CHAT domain-containing protein n=1 Tax=Laspinema olomoucense TaxID=3231600 RepID=UPI0021BAC5F9|nr:CHAT domain-containing protein [Laspinema sp. D3d]
MITPNQLRAIASLLLLSSLVGTAKPTHAQPITPAADGTGTTVNPEGQQFNIEGGQLSKDGANLFHSFEQFGLDAGQVANFLSNPDIQNILGRITGGDAAIINGLIQLTGGNSNLYLMNPAGILFGPHAQLNVPADFFATTATGIGFSEGNWLNAVGDNHWSNLVGTPSQFAFSTLQPGAIINQGNLTLEPGNNLTLLGGTLLNTGTLSAPGGNITIAAVPGESLVRISQENHLLSLDIRTGISELELPTPQSLPELLTGSGVTHANQVTVNPDGSVQLSSSEISIDTQTGDNIVSGNITTSQGQIALLGNRVAVINGDINTSGINGGGTILIGGDYQGNGPIPNAVQTFISPNTTIHADAIERGDGGQVIIWADETTQFFGNISAQGGIEFGNGGFVEVSGLEFLEYQGQVDTFAPNGNLGTLLLDPTNIEIVAAGTGETSNLNQVNAFDQPDIGGDGDTRLDVIAINDATANVILQATNDIIFNAAINNQTPGVGLRANAGNDIRVNANITLNQGNVNLNAGGGIVINNATINTGGGDFTATGTGSAATLRQGIYLNAGVINAAGGNINLTGKGFDDINTSNNYGIFLDNSSRVETAGNGTIRLEGSGGTGTDENIGIFVENSTVSGNGDITLTGTGGNGTGQRNRGVSLQTVSRVESTGGAIAITGRGGIGTDSNTGIFVDNTTTVSGNGDITLTGTGGNGTGQGNRGVGLQTGSRVESTGGGIAITGRGGTGTDENIGIFVENSTVSGNGDITLTGTGGNGTGQRNRGVGLQDGSRVESTGGGIAIEGTGGSGTNNNEGIFVDNTTTVSGNGDITLTGTGGNGTGQGNRGVGLQTGSRVESTGGAIAITGRGGIGTDSNMGIFVDNTTVSGNGDITLTGTGGNGTGQGNGGVILQTVSRVESTGGAIAIEGTGGSGTNNNEGIFVDNTTVSGNGDITLTGTGGNGTGQGNRGVILQDGSRVESTGGGIAITGRGGIGTDSNTGIFLSADTQPATTVQSGNGDITLTGIGGESSGQLNRGVSLQNGSRVESTGGAIAITGRGGIGTDENIGIFVSTNPENTETNTTINSGNGNITLIGTGNGTGENNQGIFLLTTLNNTELGNVPPVSNIESTGTGTITLEGMGANGVEGIRLENSFINQMGTSSGDVILRSNDMRLTGESRIFTNGMLTLEPIAPGDDISINNTIAEYNITTEELLMLEVPRGVLTLGSETIGNIYLGSLEESIDLSDTNYDLTLKTGQGIYVYGGIITNTQNITLNGGVNLLHPVSFTTDSGNITFTRTIDGDSNLTLNSGTGNITIEGAVGSQTELGNLTILNANNVTTESITATSLTQLAGAGSTIFNGEIVTTGANGINLTTNQITFNAPITTTGGGGVTLDNAEILEIAAPFNLEGAFQQTGMGSVILNSEITTNHNNIEFTSPVTLIGEGSLNAGTGGLVFGSSLDSGNYPLTLTAGQIEFNSPVTGTNTLTLQPATTTQNMTLGDNNVDTDSLHLTRTELEYIQDGFTAITLGRPDSSGTIFIANPLTFLDPVTIEAGSGVIAVNGMITGLDNASLALNAATIQLDSDISTDHNDIALTGNVVFGNDITLDTNSEGGDITVVGNMDGDSSLILDGGTGNIAIEGNIGSQTELGNLTILNANNVTTESITAASLTQFSGTGSTTFNGEIVITGANGINVTTNQIIFNAPIMTTGGGGLTLDNMGPLAIATPINLDGTFQQIGTGEVTLSNRITTTDYNIEFTAPVTLTGEASLNPGTGGLVFGSSLDAGNHPLTLTAGQVEFNGPVTGSNTLTLQPATTSQNMTLGNIDNVESLNLTRTELGYIEGFSSITLGRADSSGTISIGDSLTFKTPVTIEAGSGIISVNERITGSDNAALALNAATIELNFDISTDHNDIALTGNVILGNDITLDTNSEGGDITVIGNIDSNPDNPTLSNLTFNAGTGAINLRGNLGGTTPLQSLMVTSNRGTVQGNMTTDGGDITFNGAIALAEALKLSTGEGGGNITFAGTVDSETNLGKNLTLSAGTGTITFNGAVGSLQPLGNVDILNAGTITALDTIAAASFRALSSGTMTLDGNLTTTAASGVEIQSANELTVADITTNGQPLTLESQTANINTGNLDTSSATTGGAITVTSTAGEITTGNLTASGVTQGGNIRVIAEIAITAGEIDSSATIGDAGNVFLDPIGDIQVSWINSQGGTDGTGGDVFIETTGGFFRAMRSFASEYSPTGFASISTAGGTGGGSITLNHAGGKQGPPVQEFEIGNPEVNGTAEVVITGTSILNVGEIFPDSFTRGNITITTDDATPTPEPTTSQNPILPETLPEEPTSTPTPLSEPTPPEMVPEEPISTPEPVVTPEIPQELAVNDSLPQPKPIQPPRITPAPAITPEPILTVSPAPSLPLLSPPAEPEPVVSATLPLEITPDPEPTAVVEEGLPISNIENIESSLSRVEVPGRSNDGTEVAIAPLKLDTQIMTLEEAFSREYMAYFGYPDETLELLSLDEIQEVLRETEEITEVKTAVIYLMFGRKDFKENSALLCPTSDRLEDDRGDRTEEQQLGSPCDPHPEDPVELFVVTGVEEPLRFQIPEAYRELVEQLALDLRTQVTDFKLQFTDNYLASAQALHHLVMEPIEPALKKRGIQNLVFIPDAGLRSIPFAALHNGENFLIEDYSMALVPSFSLTQPRYTNLKNERVLAMGSSKFESLPPLPSVEVELNTIICTNQANRDNCWPGEVFLNESFTFNTLTQRGSSGDFRMIHLATHADFQPGDPENSYIQLWDKRVEFPHMKELQWSDPEVELLVLSSCRTAVGDEQAELGFAGLAVQSGVKSAIASVWYVNDEATLGLMSELYQQLRSAPIRAEGLRRAQLQLLRGEVRFEGGQLVGSDAAIALPKELEHLNGMDLSHPYYWSGFITIGNPW